MTDRERFIACMMGEPVDRPPYWLHWKPWASTWRRWCEAGLPDGVESFDDIRRPFEPDLVPHHLPVHCGPCPGFEQRTIAEDDDYVTWIDTWGIKRRNPKANESMSEFLAFPVTSRNDWRAYRDEHLDPDHPDRLIGNWRERAADYTARGVPTQLGYFPDVGVFGSLRWLLGDEECLLAFYTDPGLVHEIMDHMTSLYLTVFEPVASEVRVDVIHIWEDMCGRQGPLISPAHWEEFMGPCYRRIKAFAEAHGIPVISVDTDGRPDPIIPPMMDAGVNFLFPMEVAAGCDVNVLRRQFPGLAMMGGIDKRVLTAGEAAVDAELARVAPAIETRRYIPALDHLIPEDVPLDDYLYYAGALKKLVGKD